MGPFEKLVEAKLDNIQPAAFEVSIKAETPFEARAIQMALYKMTRLTGNKSKIVDNYYKTSGDVFRVTVNTTDGKFAIKQVKQVLDAHADVSLKESQLTITESSRNIPSGIRRRMNDYIHDIIKGYHKHIPLSQINGVLRSLGYELVQEDGTPWSGFLTGREGRAHIEIGIKGTGDELNIHEVVKNAVLFISWYKMPNTGRYEVVSYVT